MTQLVPARSDGRSTHSRDIHPTGRTLKGHAFAAGRQTGGAGYFAIGAIFTLASFISMSLSPMVMFSPPVTRAFQPLSTLL